MSKKVGLRKALDAYDLAASNLDYQEQTWRNLPARVKDLETQAVDLGLKLSEAQAALSKPYDDYRREWRGHEYAPKDKGAYKVYTILRQMENLEADIESAKIEKMKGLREYTDLTRRLRDSAADELVNAVDVAAARMKCKSPLGKSWERLSLEQVKERISALAKAEEEFITAEKERKSRKKVKELEGEVKIVPFQLQEGGASVNPAELLKAVKGADKSKRDYVLIGRGILIPAKTLVDWLRLVADEPERLLLTLNNRTQVLRARIGRTVAEIKGIDAEEIVNWKNDKGGPLVVDYPMGIRCTVRVNFQRVMS